MKVTGYQLREAIRRWNTRRDLAAKKFTDHTFAFEGETKDVKTVADEFAKADAITATLEDAQQRYNQLVVFNVSWQDNVSLSLAVKMIGGAGRYEKMWRGVVTDTGNDRYMMRGRAERSKDNEYAHKTVTDEEALRIADQAARRASELRAAIAVANGIVQDISGLDPSYFE